jgi:ribulose-bisphosphate carboxylase large chain
MKKGKEEALMLSGERFAAVYHIMGSAEEARAAAGDICIEQTVEYPEDLVARRDIREQIFGKVASLKEIASGLYEAAVEFAVEVAGSELTQLLNVLFGNISLKPGIRLTGIHLSEGLTSLYKGPRFGRRGLRRLLNVPRRPLLCTALKPMGLSPKKLAALAYRFALGGIDMIKDDHGLVDQAFCPFAERVSHCAEAVTRANRETGRPSLYVANVTAPVDQIFERARRAKEAGAGAIMAAPGLVGLDTMRKLADDDRLSLPILSHPALQGSFTVHPGAGMAHGVIYGRLNRLGGADACIFPNHGGRFPFTAADCRDLVEGTGCDMGPINPIFPVPAGGMRLERVGEMVDFYGPEVILLIGGDLHRHGPDLSENCRKFLHLVEKAVNGTAAGGKENGNKR